MVNEIYLSVQGESTWAGLPCIFVRLTACNLRCSYCDTAYAFREGRPWTFEAICEELARLAAPYRTASGAGHVVDPRQPGGTVPLPLIEFTGGEPLLQPGAAVLMSELCEQGWIVLVETSGAHDVTQLDKRIHRILDVKCPSSGESHRNRWENLADLRVTDEVKFVIGTWEDYAWAQEVLKNRSLAGRCQILFSWVAPLTESQRDPSLKAVPQGHRPMTRVELVEALVQDALPARFQLQMHKFIWAPEQRSV